MEADALKARLSSELSAESVEVSLDGDRAAIVVVADVFEGLSGSSVSRWSIDILMIRLLLGLFML